MSSDSYIVHQICFLTEAFLAHKSKLGSFFAYHGSPGHNFHSIIHRGLRCSLNVRSAYGTGTYLTSYLETATAYATQFGYGGYATRRYRQARYGNGPIKYCVAIVEVIKHPSVTVVNLSKSGTTLLEESKFADTSSNACLYYVVNSDEFMRLRHLLVFY